MDFDAVVVGSGAGGGMAAYALASSGLKTLVIEKGLPIDDDDLMQGEQAMMIDRIAHGKREIVINGRNDRLFCSEIPGGGTSLYGAALLRPSPIDFQPGRYYSDYLPKELWEWPFDYQTLEPYYERVEDLFDISGDNNADFGAIGTRKSPYPQKCPALTKINQHIHSRLAKQGLHPFQLPLGIDFKTCKLCPTCPGFGCPNNSRASSLNKCLKPAVDQFQTEIWNGYEAINLEYNSNHCVSSLVVKHLTTGVRLKVSARYFLIAGGAVNTPALLMQSKIKDKSNQLGRNFMYHAGALAVGVFPTPTEGDTRFIKQLGWTDYYLGLPDFPHKLGYVQMLPIPGVLTLQDQSPIPLSCVVAKVLYRHAVAFAGTVEDLPQAENRVQIGRNGSISLRHRFHTYDIFRSKHLKKQLSRTMRRCGAILTTAVTADQDDLHTAHQVGTCRTGNSEKHSVLDANCRVHGYDNLFVVDGSFMTTSLGVGPALTIMANALRVGDHIIGAH